MLYLTFLCLCLCEIISLIENPKHGIAELGGTHRYNLTKLLSKQHSLKREKGRPVSHFYSMSVKMCVGEMCFMFIHRSTISDAHHSFV